MGVVFSRPHSGRILMFLLDHGQIKKTDLLTIISSSDSLSSTLRELEGEQLISIEIKTLGRKVIYISLTPKGKAVAEQLKRADQTAKGEEQYTMPPDFDKEFENLSAMTHLNVLEDHIAITEHNYDGTGKNRIVMVYVKLNGRGIMRLFCDVDDAYECRHTRYAWTLPSVQEMVQIQRDKGNMKE